MQASVSAAFDELIEIYMRGEVLFPGSCHKVGNHLMLVVSQDASFWEPATLPLRLEVTVINDQQLAPLQPLPNPLHPNGGQWADFSHPTAISIQQPQDRSVMQVYMLG